MNAVAPETLVGSLFEAYAAGDLATVRDCLADDMVGLVTNAGGGVDRTDSADDYLARLPDLAGAEKANAQWS